MALFSKVMKKQSGSAASADMFIKGRRLFRIAQAATIRRLISNVKRATINHRLIQSTSIADRLEQVL